MAKNVNMGVLTLFVISSKFDKRANMTQRAWSIEDIPSQSGRVAIVTGASSGTGFETAKVLAAKGATVVLACRNPQKMGEAMQRIRLAYPRARVEAQLLDLASQASVRVAAKALRERFDRIDLLINNAGVMIPPYGKTEDGFETQIGTNHFGPFAFTGLLLDRLLATPGSRIVTMSSGAHRWGRIQVDDLHSERRYRPWQAYGQSKLANLLFTYELQRRLAAAGAGTIAVAAHPGWARTQLQRHMDESWWVPLVRWSGLERLLSQTAAAGALPLLRAATDPAVQGGQYFGPSGFRESKGDPILVQSNAMSHDTELQRWLWQCSEQNTGVAFAV
jgi:NAD(P)-dependent dehydrogenase (short-subunit alcohol dehydrogenase family)